MSNLIEIGKRINSRRTQLGITLDELSEKIGLTKSTLSRYETGKFGRVKLPVIQSIAGALGVDPDWILCKTNNYMPIDDLMRQSFRPELCNLPQTDLTPREQNLILAYRTAPQEIRTIVDTALAPYSSQKKKYTVHRDGNIIRLTFTD